MVSRAGKQEIIGIAACLLFAACQQERPGASNVRSKGQSTQPAEQQAPSQPPGPHQVLAPGFPPLGFDLIAVTTTTSGRFHVLISRTKNVGEYVSESDLFNPQGRELASLWAGAFGYGFAYSAIFQGYSEPAEWCWGKGRLRESLKSRLEGSAIVAMRGGAPAPPRRVEFPGIAPESVERVVINLVHRQTLPERRDEFGKLAQADATNIREVQQCVLQPGRAAKFEWKSLAIGPHALCQDDPAIHPLTFEAVMGEAAKAIVCTQTAVDPGSRK